MYAWHPPRTLSAASSVAIVAAMVALLVLGLNVKQAAQQAVSLISVAFTEPPKPLPTERPKAPTPHENKPAAKDESSPRNVRNKATQVVVPPVQPLIPPPPIVTAPKVGVGSAPNNGASNLPGPGQGAGGFGNGFGGGGRGGYGDGDSDGEPPQRISGRLSYRDLPEGVLAPGEEATVGVIYLVNPDGRASDCRIERSSGYRILDDLACQLIEQRFRFDPARDENGRPVRAGIEENHTWVANDR